MITSIQKISNQLLEFKKQLTLFLEQYSKVKRINYPGDVFFISSGDYAFVDLPEKAIPIQNKLFKDFNSQMALIEILMINSPDQYKNEVKENKKLLLEFILQDKMMWEKEITQVVDTSNKCFKKILDLLIQLYPDSDPVPILIPDTNALYFNTDIENWTYKDIKKFTLILTPSVLRDLDKHKNEHRNEEIRQKALKLINKLKEYRRRGKLIDGVTVTNDKIELKSVGIEPNFNMTLKWLDEKNEDDRLIAETLEIIRLYCNRPVVLVTADINLQNKCDVVDLAYVEPPDNIT